MEARIRSGFWIVIAALAALLLVGAHSIPLIDPDESRFARTSLEMLRSGNLVVPTYEWSPRLVKPPLMHWIQATVFRWLGASDLTARLPSLFATLGSMVIIGWVVRRRFGEEGALWAAAILGTMPLVVAVGRIGTLDALLAVHVLAAIALDVGRAEEVGGYRSAAIGALLGLGFLAKGPVGVLLPLLLMLAGRTAAGRNLLPPRRSGLVFIGAFCAVVLPWAAAFVIRIGIGETVQTLRTETLERYFAGTSHVEPPWYYAKVVLVGFVPWLAPLLLGMVRVLGRRRDPGAGTALYAAGSLLAGLLFFSLGQGKLPNYLVPLAPLAAILVTWELSQELDDRDRTTGPTLLTGTLAAFGIVLLVAADRFEPDWIRDVAITGSIVYLVGGALSVVGLVRRRPRWVYGVAALTAYTFLFVVIGWLLPALAEQRSARGLVREVGELSSDRPVVVVEMHVPSLVFYLDRVPERVTTAALGRRIAHGDEPLLVVDPDDLGAIDPEVRRRLREVGRHGKYRVYAVVGESETKERLSIP